MVERGGNNRKFPAGMPLFGNFALSAQHFFKIPAHRWLLFFIVFIADHMSDHMSDIPVELILAIVNLVEDNTVLFNLRLASKTFNAVAAPLIFRVLSVRDSVQSAEGLACLQAGDPATRSAVQEIMFDGGPIGGGSWSDEHITGQPGRDALFTAFSGLTKFPNLRTLRFEFHREFREPEGTASFPNNSSHFLLLQLGLFEVLVAHPPLPLVSLTLHHLIPIPHNIYAKEAFQNLFRPLTTLELSVLYQGGPSWYQKQPLCDFWEACVPSILKNSTNLISLTLRSRYPVGARPALALGSIHLPVLTTLSLYNFVLDPARADYDIVEFIVRHRATLTHLELPMCYVYGVERGVYARPWHAVLRRFQQELLVMCSFQVITAKESNDMFYIFIGPTGLYRVDGQACRQARDLDVVALQSLQSAVEFRSIA
ncbi:hypothetical protein K438DRAFT_1884985 [Mycena galopus ATCC 62051]|nr:hypothetical protein K438DRAFT_1884985 [Mycena galopus ATCC 62051]